MLKKEDKFLKSNLLTPFKNLSHAFSTRNGGYSQKSYHSNNLAFHVGDDKNDVITNHQLLARELGYDYTKLVHMKQIHSDIIHIVTDKDDFFNPPECDALVSNKKNIPIMIMSADCLPIIIYDPLLHVIAVVHAGRAGAFKNIASKTIKIMQEHFSCKIESLHVSLGASIHGCCYEVNESIAKEAKALGYEEMISYKETKPFLHVNTIVKKQLESIGVKFIDELEYCSACENRTFFSYRVDGRVTGRNAAIAMLTS
ncbi:MAG: peptidoglycan editing factor PgeF [Campylobacterota bacterium]|nr:peptidoglycan editing factor PgeF [Campylobacterota bacterium]